MSCVVARRLDLGTILLERFGWWAIALPLAVLVAIGWHAYSDISEKDQEEAAARAHRDRVVLAELARVNAALAARKPTTLGEARRVLGHAGWCGRFKAFNEFPTATWSPRSSIPVGDSRVWPRGDETSWGEIARASVESCEETAAVRWIESGRPESLTLP